MSELGDLLAARNDEVRTVAQHQIVKRFPGTTRVLCLCGKTTGGGYGWAQHVIQMLYAPHLAKSEPDPEIRAGIA